MSLYPTFFSVNRRAIATMAIGRRKKRHPSSLAYGQHYYSGTWTDIVVHYYSGTWTDIVVHYYSGTRADKSMQCVWYCALLCVITLKSHAEQASDFLILYINHCNSIRQRFGSLLLHTVDYMNSKLFHMTALLFASSRITPDYQNCEHGTQVQQSG